VPFGCAALFVLAPERGRGSAGAHAQAHKGKVILQSRLLQGEGLTVQSNPATGALTSDYPLNIVKGDNPSEGPNRAKQNR